MIFPVNTSTVLLTCKILQIYFDKLKLTGHKCYDGLINISEASPVHSDGRKNFKSTAAPGVPIGMGLEKGGGSTVRLLGTELLLRREGGNITD